MLVAVVTPVSGRVGRWSKGPLLLPPIKQIDIGTGAREARQKSEAVLRSGHDDIPPVSAESGDMRA